MNNIFKTKNGKEITLRQENPKDYFEVESLTRDAFWNSAEKPPCCNEHLLMYKMRKCNSFIKELDIVAEQDGKIIGNIVYTKSKVITNEEKEINTISFGPLSVLPEFQKQGVGSVLVKYTFEKARILGYNAVVIFGHPEYYPRFGFVPAVNFGLTTKSGETFDPFMAIELTEGYFNGVSGKFYEDDVFEDLPTDELIEFDKKFPLK